LSLSSVLNNENSKRHILTAVLRDYEKLPSLEVKRVVYERYNKEVKLFLWLAINSAHSHSR